MNITPEALSACKNYMKVEHTEDDALITALMQAACGYMAGKLICRTDENSSVYDLCLYALTLHYYDHRDAQPGAELPANVVPILRMLELDGSVQHTAEQEGAFYG